MEPIDDNQFAMLQSELRSGQQRSAVHAPVPPAWSDTYFGGRGSGGDLVPDLIVSTSGSLFTLKIDINDPLSLLLTRIEASFGITREELATVCSTTRKTIYNWLNGTSEPHDKNKQRLFELDVLATDWADAGYPANRAQLKRPLIDGRSVLELLCENEIDRELVLFAGSRLVLVSTPTVLSDPFSA